MYNSRHENANKRVMQYFSAGRRLTMIKFIVEETVARIKIALLVRHACDLKTFGASATSPSLKLRPMYLGYPASSLQPVAPPVRARHAIIVPGFVFHRLSPLRRSNKKGPTRANRIPFAVRSRNFSPTKANRENHSETNGDGGKSVPTRNRRR